MLPVLRSSLPLTPLAADPINRLNSLLNSFFGDESGFVSQTGSWAPLAMWEDDDHVHIEAELPGMTEEDLELTVHNGMLFIRGERRPVEGRQYLYNGRSYGRFERVVTLPDAVDTDDVQASMTNGVLCISLPKTPEARPKKITLKKG